MTSLDVATDNVRHLDLPGNGDDEPIHIGATPVTTDFPVDALPEWVADMVDAVAEATQTDPAMAGMMALTVLSATVAGHAVIEPMPGYSEQLSLYGAAIALPGDRKSAVTSAMTRPLYDVQADLIAEVEPARAEALTKARIARRAADAAEKAASTPKKAPNADASVDNAPDDPIETAMRTAREADQAEADVPPSPRLLADDATPEALAALMAAHGGRIAIISAEGGVFGQIAGRYSNGVPNLDVYLKSFDGDTLDSDRLGRERVRIDRPALAIGCAVQPGILAEAINNRALTDSGLIQRFSFARTRSRLGHRNVNPDPVPERVAARYRSALRTLATAAHGQAECVTLRLSPAAARAYAALAAKIEPRLNPKRGDSLVMQGWASKHVGRVMRIAGLIHVGIYGIDSATMPVQPESIHAADRIGEYLWDSARATFSEAVQTDDDKAAAYLVQKLAEKFEPGDVVADRDLLRTARRFKTRAELAPIRARLVDLGYLDEVDTEQGHAPRWRVTDQVTGVTA